MSKEAEKEAAKAAKEAEKEAAKAPASEFEVNAPQELRPVELPLVIKPTSGSWANDEQATYAKVLNIYAYKNPAKWEIKKDVLLAQLSEIGKNPARLAFYQGVQADAQGVTYKNTAINN